MNPEEVLRAASEELRSAVESTDSEHMELSLRWDAWHELASALDAAAAHGLTGHVALASFGEYLLEALREAT
ncbi:hypothetical protein [Kineococcus terrestris]|uniref:hypothetical protein n=1 Tax=Kineococcus terrestris TaxID=2044856 RepID=UPI0034DAD4E8